MSENQLTKLSNAMAEAVEQASAYTVMVNARKRMPASGIAIGKDLILTANHVVRRDEDISVTLPDGSQVAASVAGRDPGSDLALLKLETADATPAEFNGELRVGELALAIGRPTSEGVQASLGIVSAVGGPAHTAHGGILEKIIRTDAIPYPGFSGGPLIDSAGKVIGINTSGLGHGNSIAVPISIARQIAESLEKHGSVKRGYIGIRSQLVDLPAKAKLDREQKAGLLVNGLEDDSPAAAAGLMVGDIIIGFNGQAVNNHDELLAALSGEVVDTATPLEILRGGQVESLSVTASERPEPQRRHRGGGPRGMRGMRRRGKRGGRGRHGGHHGGHEDHNE